MNTHRLTSADFDAPTQPAVHEATDTQWPAFTEPMRFDADAAAEKRHKAESEWHFRRANHAMVYLVIALALTGAAYRIAEALP